MKKVLIISIVLLSMLVSAIIAEDASDPILEFYSTRAKDVFNSRQPEVNGLVYSFTTKTYYKPLDKYSNPILKDSLIEKYYYSFGQLDSTQVISEADSFDDKPDLSTANIFSNQYQFFFYPNDTGGANIAIGFDADIIDSTIPIGFAVIDRDRYFLKWLYLYNMADRKDKRYSRWLRYVEHEGFIFPDSVWEIKANIGVFSTNYYRLESGISDIQISR